MAKVENNLKKSKRLAQSTLASINGANSSNRNPLGSNSLGVFLFAFYLTRSFSVIYGMD